MSIDKLKILLIEDDPADATLIREILEDSQTIHFDILHASSLEEGIQFLSGDFFHLVLLDLHLYDSEGIDTFIKLKNKATELPVIILTGIDDEALGVKLLQMGAQDYLSKGSIDHHSLHRAVRYSIERYRLRLQLEQECRKNTDAAEIKYLEQIKGLKGASTTADLMGQTLLRKSLPDTFKELVNDYTRLVDHSLKSRFYKTDYNTTDEAHEIADKLGYLKSSPRDLIDIHITVVTANTDELTAKQYTDYNSEARLVLLEVMGNLISYYRVYALGR